MLLRRVWRLFELTEGNAAHKPLSRVPGRALNLTLALGCVLAPVVTEAESGAEVTIHQDRFGVSHIIGNSRDAVAYGLGYAIARDRPLQMEGFRLRAMGTRASVHGAGKNGRLVLADYRSRLLFGGGQALQGHLLAERRGRVCNLAREGGPSRGTGRDSPRHMGSPLTGNHRGHAKGRRCPMQTRK